MSRVTLPVCAVLLAVSPARAADPQPLWEIDPTQPKMQALEVNWVGFSRDGKTLVARVVYLPDKKPKPFELVRSPEQLLAFDTGTRKELLRMEVGEQLWRSGGPAVAATGSGTLLVARDNTEVRLADGKVRPLLSDAKHSVGVWVKPAAAESLWLFSDGVDGCWLAGRNFAAFDTDLKPLRPKRQAATELSPPTDEHAISAVAVSPNLTRLVAAFRRGSESVLRVYKIETGDTLTLTELATVPGTHRAIISSLAFTPDGKMLAVGSADRTVSLWDVTKVGKDWKPEATIRAGEMTVSCLAFSPDGRTLAAGTFDGKGKPNLFLIDVRGGKLVSSRTLDGQITAVAYSPDGKLLVTGHNRGAIRVWDAAAMRDH